MSTATLLLMIKLLFSLLCTNHLIHATKRKRSDAFRIALSSAIPIQKSEEMDQWIQDIHFEVESLSLESSFPAQPVGKGMTRGCAMQRALKTMRIRPNATIWVGVENGMYRDPPTMGQVQDDAFKHWFDISRLVIIYDAVCKDKGSGSSDDVSCGTLPVDEMFTPNTRISRQWSEPFPITESQAQQCLTADGVSARNDGNRMWSSYRDPLSVFSNGIRSRRIWLQHALKKWIIDNFNEIQMNE